MHWRITVEAVDPTGEEYRQEFLFEKDLNRLDVAAQFVGDDDTGLAKLCGQPFRKRPSPSSMCHLSFGHDRARNGGKPKPQRQ